MVVMCYECKILYNDTARKLNYALWFFNFAAMLPLCWTFGWQRFFLKGFAGNDVSFFFSFAGHKMPNDVQIKLHYSALRMLR